MIYSSCNIYQRTFRKGYLLRNIYAACIPQGVRADSSRPHHQQKQPILVCKILLIAMPTVETKYEKRNIV
ncbi:hypothetical protein HMPREF9144_2196 [Prevotella pallens ATCC 700821]|uniref:Uncharacterized protein n=2 Tax=Prevotella pallens TaxID=60133 RepID=A0ABX9DUP2_9BACT|nr:hypothetical protein [Prevotella pallens]EGQ14264.1 hypothetical protein HMPREF9144_2196 [Prevotella pallens ATCC 700821]MBF1503850.1 hypothetical protein [Prevotella pallens]RAS45828.1 hypothetical protein BC673_10858 [Prevotella pallens]